MIPAQKLGLQLRRDGGVTRLPAPVHVPRARIVITAAAAGPRGPGAPLQPNAPTPTPGVATKAASADFGVSVAIPAAPAPRAAPKDMPKIEPRKLQEVVALGEPAFYAYRDAAICAGTLSVEMSHSDDRHTHNGAEDVGKPGQAHEDDGTLVTFANTAFGHVLIEKNFRGRLRLEATIVELPTGLATTVPPLLLEVTTAGDQLPRNYHTRTTAVLDNTTTLDLLLADPEAVRSGAASVRLSLRKHVRLGKTDPEEVVSLGDPVTLDLSSSEPQQLLVGGLTLHVRASLATFDGKPGYDGADSTEQGNAWAPDPLPGTWPDLHTWYRRWSAASKGADNLDAAFGAESLRLRGLTGQAAPLYEPVAFISYVCHSRWGVDSQAWVMINPTLKHVVLAFRGTTSAADWAADVNAIRINPYGAKPRVDGKEGGEEVHRGFYTALQVVAEDLYKSMDSLIEASGDPEGWRVVCTGHSLGGALATLAAYDLMRRGPPGRRVWLTTFGSPRVGNKAFAEDFMERQRRQGEVHAYRVANDADPVPKTPVGWNGNYWHVGTPVVLEASGGKVEADNTDSGLGAQLWDLFSGMTGMVTADLMKGQVAVMHSWPEYLKNLRAMVDQVAGRKGGATVA